jgi:hypothetical protein
VFKTEPSLSKQLEGSGLFSKPSQAERAYQSSWAGYCIQKGPGSQKLGLAWARGKLGIVFKTEPSREPIKASGWLGIVFKTEPSREPIKAAGFGSGLCSKPSQAESQGRREPKAAGLVISDIKGAGLGLAERLLGIVFKTEPSREPRERGGKSSWACYLRFASVLFSKPSQAEHLGLLSRVCSRFAFKTEPSPSAYQSSWACYLRFASVLFSKPSQAERQARQPIKAAGLGSGLNTKPSQAESQARQPIKAAGLGSGLKTKPSQAHLL